MQAKRARSCRFFARTSQTKSPTSLISPSVHLDRTPFTIHPKPETFSDKTYLTQSVFKVVLQKSTKPQSPTSLISPSVHSALLFYSASLSVLELSDTKVYELCIRALIGTASHFYEVVVPKLRTVLTLHHPPYTRNPKPSPTKLIPHKLFLKSFCRSRFSHKSVRLSFTITDIKNNLTDFCGSCFSKTNK